MESAATSASVGSFSTPFVVPGALSSSAGSPPCLYLFHLHCRAPSLPVLLFVSSSKPTMAEHRIRGLSMTRLFGLWVPGEALGLAKAT